MIRMVPNTDHTEPPGSRLALSELTIELQHLYARFDAESAPFRNNAVCQKGCSFCCTHYGTLDITTLEGLIIYQWIGQQAKPARKRLWQAIKKNKHLKQRHKSADCPFLDRHHACMLYHIRPFSCRQLYSLKRCGQQGPTVHRQTMALARTTVYELQQLDSTGYSGHISYILHLCADRQFRNVYRSGGFDPSQIMAFGKSHGIVINRMAARP
jgi:hypothetical protein